MMFNPITGGDNPIVGGDFQWMASPDEDRLCGNCRRYKTSDCPIHIYWYARSYDKDYSDAFCAWHLYQEDTCE